MDFPGTGYPGVGAADAGCRTTDQERIRTLSIILKRHDGMQSEEYSALENRLVWKMDEESRSIYRKMQMLRITCIVLHYYTEISQLEDYVNSLGEL